jgi:DNA primase
MKILKPGKSLRFVFLKDGEDPDNLVFKSKKKEINNLVGNAMSMFDAFWNSEILNLDLKTPEKRAAFRLLMEKKISVIEDKIVQREYKKSFYDYYNNMFSGNYLNKNDKAIKYKNSNIKLDQQNADRVNKKSYASFREKNLIESIFNNPSILKMIEEDFSLLIFSNRELELIKIALLDLYKKNGNLTELNIIELKDDIRYASLIKEIFKINDWAISKFVPDFVKRNEDLNYVVKCWLEAANIQKLWYKKLKN